MASESTSGLPRVVGATAGRGPAAGGGVRWWVLATALAVGLFAVRLPVLPRAPVDLDAVNFLLALEDYDIAKHQPQPPGYPVFVFVAKLVERLVPATVTDPRLPVEIAGTQALALVSLAAASVLLVAWWATLRGWLSARRALAASLVLACAPLAWIQAVRPLSDMAGLSAVSVVTALLFPSPRQGLARSQALWRLGLAAGLAGLAAGVRSQTVWFTLPLLAWTLVRDHRLGARPMGVALAGGVAGAALWVIPTSVAVGGVTALVELVFAQGQEDWRDAAILATHPSPRVAARALAETFMAPWGPVWLAVPVLGLSALGALRAVRERSTLALALGVGFLPYLAFHLLFHETAHIRYALPLLAPVTALAVYALPVRPGGGTPLVWGTVVVLSLLVGWPASRIYAREGGPLAQLMQAVERLRRQPVAAAEHGVGAVGMHHSVALATRGLDLGVRRLGSPVRYEWLAVVDHFRDGGAAPVWFFANGRRTDLALLDPASRHVRDVFRWDTTALMTLLGGTRPATVDVVEIDRPGWMLAQGWALTPETAAVARRRRLAAAGRADAEGFVLARDEAATLLIGLTNFGGPCATATRATVSIGGRAMADVVVPASARVHRLVRLPAGALAGQGYLPARVTLDEATGSGQAVDVALDQFDLQSGRAPIAAFGDGWHEAELDAERGRSWRWISNDGRLVVESFGRDVEIVLDVEGTRRYFTEGSSVSVRVGEQVLATEDVGHDRRVRIPVPATALAAADREIRITTDASFIPASRGFSRDRRVLGARVWALDVRFADAPGDGRSKRQP